MNTIVRSKVYDTKLVKETREKVEVGKKAEKERSQRYEDENVDEGYNIMREKIAYHAIRGNKRVKYTCGSYCTVKAVNRIVERLREDGFSVRRGMVENRAIIVRW